MKLSTATHTVRRSVTLAVLLLAMASGHSQQPVATPQWRPLYHFTPARNWTNDPNGLIFLGGKYHLYNQQNPFGNDWGHMSWGHAVSTDLVHWKHLPLALPETIGKDTTWRFSGSAVWDTHNSSGFCQQGPCMVIVYTADQPNLKKESQFVAFSNDSGKTFTNYPGNPVIDLQKKDFRDPSVTWNEQLKLWLMTVALPAEHKVSFYTSPDLKAWTLLSQFGPAGYTGANWECPALMQVPVENRTGEKKWVLCVSAAGGDRGVFEQYFMGNFDGRQFTADEPDSIRPVDYGDCFYAAIPWNDAPGGRIIYLGWLVPGKQPTFPWRGQMSIPRDLSARQHGDGWYLLQQPTAIISKRLSKFAGSKKITVRNMVLSGKDRQLIASGEANGNAYWMDAEISITPGTHVGFEAGRKSSPGRDSAVIRTGYDDASHTFYLDKHPSPGKPLLSPGAMQAGVAAADNRIKIRLLFDKSSVEVFFQDGEKVFTVPVYPEKGATGLSVFAEGGKATIRSLTIWDLSGTRQP